MTASKPAKTETSTSEIREPWQEPVLSKLSLKDTETTLPQSTAADNFSKS